MLLHGTILEYFWNSKEYEIPGLYASERTVPLSPIMIKFIISELSKILKLLENVRDGIF